MAEAAADIDDKSEAAAIEAVEAYTRLWEQARKLNERAGWDAEEFDQEVPFAEFADAPSVEDHRARAYRLRALNGPLAVFGGMNPAGPRLLAAASAFACASALSLASISKTST